MEKVIQLLPGLNVVIDTDKFEDKAVLPLGDLQAGDYVLSLDLTLVNVLEKTEQQVKNIVQLRTR